MIVLEDAKRSTSLTCAQRLTSLITHQPHVKSDGKAAVDIFVVVVAIDTYYVCDNLCVVVVVYVFVVVVGLVVGVVVVVVYVVVVVV